MFRFDPRLKKHISLLVILLGILIAPISAEAISAGAVEYAVHVLTHPGGFSPKAVGRAQAIVAAHGHELSLLRISNRISNAELQFAHKYWHKVNKMCLENSSTGDIVVKVPECPEKVNVGSDIDAIGTQGKSGGEITLKKMETVWDNFQGNLRDFCEARGYEPPPGLLNKKMVDTMPDDKYTPPREHAKITYEINKRGGCAYADQGAVRAEIKLSQGENLNMTEAAAYQAEMRGQIAKQLKLSKNAKTPAESQLYNSRAAKYIKRYAKLNEYLRRRHLSTPHRTDITGLDAAVDEIALAGRGGQTKLAAAKVRGLMKHASQKACRQFIETNIEIAEVYGPRSGMGRAAGRNIARELN